MNNYSTKKIKQMRLGAMAQLHHQYMNNNQLNDITAEEYLALLTDHELKQKASFAEVNYATSRNLDKNMFVRLGSSLDLLLERKR